MKSQWCKWLAEPGHIRLVAIEATELMQGLCRQQRLEGEAQRGYAEAIVGTMLIASAHKSNEAINMNAKGSALYKQAIVDASPEGKVRGFLIEEKNPELHTYGEHGHNGPWGSGILSILYTKNFEGKYPYTGMVPISTGFLDDAINEYYRDSEQLVSKVGLWIEQDGTSIKTARGALVQALGGATPDELEAIQNLDIKTLRHLAEQAADFNTFRDAASQSLSQRRFQLTEMTPLTAFCTCSQERVERALVLTGEQDTLEALGDDAFLNISCDFCRREYKISAERIKSLFREDSTRLQ